jgi:hypothetical protein
MLGAHAQKDVCSPWEISHVLSLKSLSTGEHIRAHWVKSLLDSCLLSLIIQAYHMIPGIEAFNPEC